MNSKILKTRDDVLETLNGLNIAYKEYTHAPALNIEDLRNDPKKLEQSPFLKNLVYVDKKKNYYFLVAHEGTNVSKAFWKTLGTTHNNVRFISEDALASVLHTYKGAVNPFALQNDTEKQIKSVIFDQKLENCEYLSFHPQDNKSTLELKQDCVKSFLTSIGRTFEFKNFEVEEAPVAEEKKPAEAKKADKKTDAPQADDNKYETKLKLEFKKVENFAGWYSQIITKADLLDYYDISGCYILKPNAYFLWEQIQRHLDDKFKGLGVKNCYFPMFVKKKNLESEKEHVEGFSAEVAWVTHSGSSKLAEPIAIRPTSETIMYPVFSKWIHSHRDLPLLLNQWTNVVRWEFKHPTPFIRTREFLWQEGHTAHATKAESDKMVFDILDIYADTYKNLLAIPVIKGIKSKNEKFAGADYTTTCETFVAENGRSIQACTSHSLGQNFAKIFDITFEDVDMKRAMAWQTSWGFTTRSLGIIIMIHGDDQGLILPPKIAPVQVVIVPIYFKGKNDEINQRCRDMKKLLADAGIRVEFDDRDNYTVGFKFNDWEIRGTPIRLELGPKDLQANEVRLVRRVDNEKIQIKMDSFTHDVQAQLQECHNVMYQRASEKLNSNIIEANNWTDFMNILNQSRVVKTPWCENSECEDIVKQKSGIESKMNQSEDKNLSGSAKTLCLPLEQSPLEETAVCFHCSKPAKKWVIWGRSY